MRSSVAPRGSSTSGVRICSDGSASPAATRSSADGPMRLVSVGCELNASPFTTSMKGSTCTSERTCTHQCAVALAH